MLKESFKVVYKGGVGEIEEKKSRFIATVIPITSEEEAILFIESMKKKYWVYICPVTRFLLISLYLRNLPHVHSFKRLKKRILNVLLVYILLKQKRSERRKVK